MGQIVVNTSACSRCGICQKACPARIIQLHKESRYPYIPEEDVPYCIDCGHCAVYCPRLALTHDYAPTFEKSPPYRRPDITTEQVEMYLKGRRSVRLFADAPVEREKILRIMDTVRYSPTAVNMQQVKWVIVHDTAKVKKLVDLTIDWMKYLIATKSPEAEMLNAAEAVDEWANGRDTVFRNAPHLAAVYTPTTNSFAEKDAMIALSYLDVTLPAFGLGGFWTGYFKFAADAWAPIREELGIPEDHRIVYGIAFGNAKHPINAIPERKPADIIWR